MRNLILIISFCFIIVSAWIGFTAGAIEPVSKNIIYLHVPASISAIICFTVLFVCSIQYLRTRKLKWYYISAASGEVGLIFATTLNITGMIFAHAEWGICWTPSVRLISSAMLWFLYAGYCLLRTSFKQQDRLAKISSVFGIIAFIDVPIVYISARFFRDIHRPAFAFETNWQRSAFGLAVLGTLILAAVLISVRSEILQSAQTLKNTKKQG